MGLGLGFFLFFCLLVFVFGFVFFLYFCKVVHTSDCISSAHCAYGSMPIFAEFRHEPFWSLTLKKSETQIIYAAPH